MRRLALVLAVGLTLAASCSGGTDDSAPIPSDPAPQWVSTWAASQQPFDPPLVVADPARFEDQTIRQIVRVSVGGRVLRVRFSNEYGTTALHIGAARVARHSNGAGIVPGTDHVLRFNGRTTARVPKGSFLLSDPVSLNVPALHDLAVSAYLPDAAPAATFHASAIQTTYVARGDATAVRNLPVASTTTSWFFLDEISVEAASATATVVALGDSITNGFMSTVDANQRWPNRLASRLQTGDASTRNVAVVNRGIDGNRLLHDGLGPSVQTRFDRDVLATPGVRFVILAAGINDIGLPGMLDRPGESVSAEEIIAGYEQLIERAHEHGLKIFGGTLTPFGGTEFPGYFSSAGEEKRARINSWIRTSGRFDAVIDFDAATRDPALPTRLRPAYDSGDHLHPNDAGYTAMADAIDLRLFSAGS